MEKKDLKEFVFSGVIDEEDSKALHKDLEAIFQKYNGKQVEFFVATRMGQDDECWLTHCSTAYLASVQNAIVKELMPQELKEAFDKHMQEHMKEVEKELDPDAPIVEAN
jgi:hypothetical protein